MTNISSAESQKGIKTFSMIQDGNAFSNCLSICKQSSLKPSVPVNSDPLKMIMHLMKTGLSSQGSTLTFFLGGPIGPLKSLIINF